MSKRRRANSLPRYTEDDSLDSYEASTSSGPTSHKRRKIFDPMEVCHQLVDILRNHKKDDGTLLSESFIRVPKRRQEPAYYDVVSSPIDLIKVQQKLKMDEYEDVEDLHSDIELMVKNAKSFYKRNTQEFKDAVELMDLFLTNKYKLLNLKDPSPAPSRRSYTNSKQITPAKHSPGRPPSQRNSKYARRSENSFTRSFTRSETRNNQNHDNTSEDITDDEEEEEEEDNEKEEQEDDDDDDDDSCPFEELLSAVMTAKDENNKLLYPAFKQLPSKKDYPDYYEVVEQPVDLKIITKKVEQDKYKYLFELEKDVLLMCKNACLYNEPGSHIYKQAKALRKFVQAKRIEIDQRRGTMPIMATPNRHHPNSTPNNIRNRTSLNSSRSSINSNNTPNSGRLKNNSTRGNSRFSGGLNSSRNSPINSSVNKNSLSSVSVNRRGRKPMKNNRIITTPNSVNDSFRFKRRIRGGSVGRGGIVRSGSIIRSSSVGRTGSIVRRRGRIARNVMLGRNGNFRSGSIGRPMSIGSTSTRDDSDADPYNADSDTDLSNPHWKLFETVRTASGSNGALMSEPFWKLPSRKFYPDYYREIKNPMSLGQIRKKLVNRGYGTLSEMAGDLTIMFENAKMYNIPTSKLYKDAVRLQKLMQSKVQELLDVDQVTQRVTNKTRKLFTENPVVVRKKPGPKPKNLLSSLDLPRSPRGRPPKDAALHLKKRLHLIAKYMLDYTTEDGRKPMLAFIEKPSKMLYPEYYEIIAEPIDFLEIESKIKAEQYSCEADLVKDFKLMFSNCREFNEENSPIYEDANLLEKYLLNKVAHLKPINITPDRPKRERIVLKPYKPRRILSPLEKILKTLYEAIRYYRDPKDNRQISQTFMKLPSRNEYPDYYEVIINPIDMDRISQKIRAQDYENLEELVSDFVLLFDNACKYNEPDSQIYKDALVLQRFLFQTKMQLKDDENNVPDVSAIVQDIFLNLFTNVYNYQDHDGRCYSDSMADLPEHEEVEGKKVRALSLDLIKRRLDKGLYKRLDAFQEDFFACLERARRISRTDSQVFEDSIEMQLYFIKQRDELCRNGELLSSPALIYTESDARASIDDLRADKALKESIDDETETRSSSGDSVLKEINVNEENDSNSNNRDENDDCSTKDDKSNIIDNKKTDDADINNVVKEDNTNSDNSDSKETKPSEEIIVSENSEVIEKASEEINGCINTGDDEEKLSSDGRTFKEGEFVYLDAKDKNCEPHIVCIERLWENNGQKMLYGNHFLRPAETYHVTSRKFLEREVFKSDKFISVSLDDVLGRCCVVNFKYYYTMKPEGFDDEDIYVCESRYRTRLRLFKKIKVYPDNPTIKLIPRDVPLPQKRVMSVFKERIEKHKDELQELEDLERLIEKDKPNVVAYSSIEIDDGNTYYEQFNTVCSGVIKTGDYVYVVADGGKQIIAQIDSIWETKDGKCYFRGPWFILPSDMPHNPTRLFYKQEVFLSSLEETSPIVSIIGKCHVLELNDWVLYRPTEIPESDVFICASMYDEINRQVKKLPYNGLKKYSHSSTVTDDEIYFFSRILHPPKMTADELKVFRNAIKHKIESSPQLTKMNDMDVIMEDSLDGGPPSVGSGEIPVVVTNTPVTTPVSTPVPSSKKKSNKNKVVTGYILYSREVRKQVVQNNPESTFGDISRIVGSEWKSLPQNEKQQWEEKASKLNEETKALLVLEQEQCGSPAPPAPPPPPPVDQIFECLWDNCDYQFEEVSDLIEHCIKDKESQGHVQAFYQENAGMDFNCYWRNCSRAKKNLQPFPNITRLIRHVRDLHINKGNGRSVPPENRSKNFKPSSKPPAVTRPTSSATPNAPASNTFNTSSGIIPSSITVSSSSNVLSPNAQKPQEPMFISVPPRPQRVLHSEAYIKYIEGLQAENKHITPWERTLQATQENTPEPDVEKLKQVAAWLGRKADQHDQVVAALWTLRNQLLKDTLSLHKTL